MHVVLGVDDNPVYRFYLPMTVKIWQAFNVEPLVFHVSDTPVELDCEVVPVKPNPNWPTAWQAKASRLTLSCVRDMEDGFHLLSDVDMWPLRIDWLDWRHRNRGNLFHWGGNLHSKKVICYMGGTVFEWRWLSKIDGQGDPGTPEDHIAWIIPFQQAINEDPTGRFSDETVLTRWSHMYGQTILSFVRPMVDGGGPPADRIDRSNWDAPEPRNPWDAHLPHDGWNHIPRLLDLFGRVCPDEVDWARNWMENFECPT